VIAAWETKEEVYFSRIDRQSGRLSTPLKSPGKAGRKHGAVAGNSRGETILVWAEGTGWQRGGALAWQVFDRAGRPTDAKGRIDGGIPVWGLPAVVARSDGSFLIVH
jgi:hypothetical protein